MKCDGNCSECFNHLYNCFPVKGSEEYNKWQQEELEQLLKDEDLLPEYYDFID